MADLVSANAQFPSGSNTYIPSFDATGQLVVSFSRNPKDFPLNKCITITPVKKSSGYYLKLNAEQAARVTNTKLNDHVGMMVTMLHMVNGITRSLNGHHSTPLVMYSHSDWVTRQLIRPTGKLLHPTAQ